MDDQQIQNLISREIEAEYNYKITVYHRLVSFEQEIDFNEILILTQKYMHQFLFQ
jgi:hypothetical protein